MGAQTKSIKTFRNPSGYWSHDGAFSVELTDDADIGIVPSSAQVLGRVVQVENGRIKQSMGGIQLYSREHPFFWGYNKIKVIKDGSGNLLWVNNNYR